MVTRFYTGVSWIYLRPAAWAALVLCALATAAAGAEQRTVALAEADLSVQVLAADGPRLVIWLPPEEGPSPR